MYKGVHGVLVFAGEVVATTEGLVLVLGPYRDLSHGPTGLAEGEDGRGAVAAACTEGSQLVDLVGEGDEVEELPERAALGVPVEADANHLFSVRVNGLQTEGLEVGEELGLFDDDTGGGLELGGLQKG